MCIFKRHLNTVFFKSIFSDLLDFGASQRPMIQVGQVIFLLTNGENEIKAKTVSLSYLVAE